MAAENLKKLLQLFSFSAPPTREELRKRYRELIKQCHPDHHPDNAAAGAASTRRTQELNRAYAAILSSLPRASAPPAPPRSASPTVDLVREGDRALQRAVLSGCLVRHPRDGLVAALRERLSVMARTLDARTASGSASPAKTFREVFFRDLFVCFLRSTEPGVLLQGLESAHPTRHFRRLMQANGRLDAGVRAFYRYLDSGRLGTGTLAEIPASHLDEAGRAYAGLLAESSDPRNRSLLQARCELARLFTQRIRDPRLKADACAG